MNTKVTVSNTTSTTRVTTSRLPQVITVNSSSVRLSGLSDVEMSGISDGALLQYDAASQQWIAENILEKSGLQINCGNF